MAADNMTIQDVMAKNTMTRGDEIAFVCRDERWTFGQFERDVLHLAAGLAALGASKGDRIAVIAFNCYEFFLVYGAAAHLGAIVVPINWRLTAEEIGVILQDCAPIAVVAGQEQTGAVVEALDARHSVEHRLVIGEATQGFRSMSALAGVSDSLQPVSLSANDPFVIIYTATVQGRPRGAVLTHGNIMAASLQVIVPMEIHAADVHLNLMPLFHVMGLELAMGVIYAGGRNVIVNKFDPAEAVECVRRERVTMIPTVPPMLSAILDQARGLGSES